MEIKKNSFFEHLSFKEKNLQIIITYLVKKWQLYSSSILSLKGFFWA